MHRHFARGAAVASACAGKLPVPPHRSRLHGAPMPSSLKSILCCFRPTASA